MRIHRMYLITAGLVVICVSKESSKQMTFPDIKSNDLLALKMRNFQRLEPRMCPPHCEPIPPQGNLRGKVCKRFSLRQDVTFLMKMMEAFKLS